MTNSRPVQLPRYPHLLHDVALYQGPPQGAASVSILNQTRPNGRPGAIPADRWNTDSGDAHEWDILGTLDGRSRPSGHG